VLDIEFFIYKFLSFVIILTNISNSGPNYIQSKLFKGKGMLGIIIPSAIQLVLSPIRLRIGVSFPVSNLVWTFLLVVVFLFHLQ